MVLSIYVLWNGHLLTIRTNITIVTLTIIFKPLSTWTHCYTVVLNILRWLSIPPIKKNPLSINPVPLPHISLFQPYPGPL